MLTVFCRRTREEIVNRYYRIDTIVAVGGLVRISNCAVLNEGELVDYHMPWNPIVGM